MAIGSAQPGPGQVERLLALPSGDLLSVTNRTDSLQTTRWSADGEPMIVHTYGERAPMGAERLALGQVLVPDANASRVFNGVGELESFLPAGGGYVTELGPDSLLFCWQDRVRLQRADGTILWERALELPVVPEGGVISRAASLADGFVVYSGISDVYTTAILLVGVYDASGTLERTITIHADGGSMTRPHAMSTLQNGEVLGVATMGNGKTRLVRMDTSGDTLWTRHFGSELDAPGYPAVFHAERALELADGRIVLAGYAGAGWSYEHLAWLVLDAQGHPICLEPVVELAEGTLTFDVALDSAGDLRLLYALEGEVPVLIRTLEATLCLGTAVRSEAEGPCWALQRDAAAWSVDRSDCLGEASYTLYDPAGRVLQSGELHARTTFSTSSQLRFLRVVERRLGLVRTVKLPAVH